MKVIVKRDLIDKNVIRKSIIEDLDLEREYIVYGIEYNNERFYCYIYVRRRGRLYIKKLPGRVFNISESNLSVEWVIDNIESFEGVCGCVMGYPELVREVIKYYRENIDKFSMDVRWKLEDEILLRYEELEMKRESK